MRSRNAVLDSAVMLAGFFVVLAVASSVIGDGRVALYVIGVPAMIFSAAWIARSIIKQRKLPS